MLWHVICQIKHHHSTTSQTHQHNEGFPVAMGPKAISMHPTSMGGDIPYSRSIVRSEPSVPLPMPIDQEQPTEIGISRAIDGWDLAIRYPTGDPHDCEVPPECCDAEGSTNPNSAASFLRACNIASLDGTPKVNFNWTDNVWRGRSRFFKGVLSS